MATTKNDFIRQRQLDSDDLDFVDDEYFYEQYKLQQNGKN